MDDLETALRLIQQHIQFRQARCVIVGDTSPHESLLLGTRDGFLNMARVLLEFVIGVEQGKYQEEDNTLPYSSDLVSVMYQLPTFDNPFIVGMELLPDHTQLMTALSRLVDLRTRERVLHDPQFEEPI